MLEALLKRVDGLEQKLKEKNKGDGELSPVAESSPSASESQSLGGNGMGVGDTKRTDGTESETGGDVATAAVAAVSTTIPQQQGTEQGPYSPVAPG